MQVATLTAEAAALGRPPVPPDQPALAQWNGDDSVAARDGIDVCR